MYIAAGSVVEGGMEAEGFGQPCVPGSPAAVGFGFDCSHSSIADSAAGTRLAVVAARSRLGHRSFLESDS